MDGYKVASVSDLVSAIKSHLESEFHEVMVEGEVTNLSTSASGHWYFNLSDDEASLSCALFKGDALRNPLIKSIKDGDKIAVLGPLSVYQKRGTFQLVAKRLVPAGEGKLKLQFEKLKAKLASEGLFDLDKKRPLPVYPKKIAILTAEQGAALQDFLEVMRRRALWFDILIVPCLVQGDGAAPSLIKALNYLETREDIDVVILARGGGSLEDLWAFNDEALARKLAGYKHPTISAVGHQVDFSLTDYVADLRCETPTAAAETLSQPQTVLKSRMQTVSAHLKKNMQISLLDIAQKKESYHPREMIVRIKDRVQGNKNTLNRFSFQKRGEILVGLHEKQMELDEVYGRFSHQLKMWPERINQKLNSYYKVLCALSPKDVLKRGYSFIESKEHSVIASKREFDKLDKETSFSIHFHDGEGKVKKA